MAAPAPTGTIAVMNGTTQVALATLISDGSWAVQDSSLGVGTYNLTAVYSGDANWNSVTSNVLVQVVQVLGKSTPVITFNSSPNPSAPGDTIVFNGTVLPS